MENPIICSEDLSETDLELRMLTVLYECSHVNGTGSASEKEIADRFNELGVGEMTTDEFDEYSKRVLARFPIEEQ